MSTELVLNGFGRLMLDEPPPFRILYVEDDETFSRSAVENLAERGLTQVDVAVNSSQASALIQSQIYDVVMADVVLDNAPHLKSGELQGDEWMLDNLAHLQGAKCALVTGRRKRITDFDRVRKAGIRVVEKGEPALEFFSELEDDAKLKSKALADRLVTAVEHALTGRDNLPATTAGDALIDEAARTLSGWIESLEDSDKQDVWIAGRTMAPREMLAEIGARSHVGRRLIRMFVRELAEGLGVAAGDKGNDE